MSRQYFQDPLNHRYMTLQDGYDENMTYFAHYTVAVAVGDVRGEEEEINITCVYTKNGGKHIVHTAAPCKSRILYRQQLSQLFDSSTCSLTYIYLCLLRFMVSLKKLYVKAKIYQTCLYVTFSFMRILQMRNGLF